MVVSKVFFFTDSIILLVILLFGLLIISSGFLSSNFACADLPGPMEGFLLLIVSIKLIINFVLDMCVVKFAAIINNMSDLWSDFFVSKIFILVSINIFILTYEQLNWLSYSSRHPLSGQVIFITNVIF